MKWISIEDRLPDTPSKYLVYTPQEGIRESWFSPNKQFALSVLYGISVTHWMPLPEPPNNQ